LAKHGLASYPFVRSRLASIVNFAKQVREERRRISSRSHLILAHSCSAERSNFSDPTIFPTTIESPGERHAHHGILTSSFDAPSLPFSAFTNSTTTFAPPVDHAFHDNH